MSAGAFHSRTTYLSWLVEREEKRLRAREDIHKEDIQKMRAEGTLHDPELAAVVAATSGRSLAHLH